MFMPGRDTMHLRNNKAAGLFLFLLLATGPFLRSQGQPDKPQSQPAKPQLPSTPLPSDIDPADPALPVWARPAPTAAAANSDATKPAANANTPPGQIKPPERRVGEVTRSGGTYV